MSWRAGPTTSTTLLLGKCNPDPPPPTVRYRMRSRVVREKQLPCRTRQNPGCILPIRHLTRHPDERSAMVRPVSEMLPPLSAGDCGRICAVAGQSQRDLQECAALYEVWRQEFQRMLDAMVREWGWQSRRTTDPHAALPSFEEYLANADNICFSFVYVSHWVTTSGPPPVRHIEELLAAGRATQRVIRLLNDIGTYDRDRTWGDLNVMMLGVSAEDLDRHIAALAAQCEEQLRRLHADSPQLAVFLARYIRFNSGFYRTTDYWGTL